MEIEVKMCENRKKKEIEEEENLLIDGYLCVNACHICYCNLIREEGKIMQKEMNEHSEKLKEQVIKAKRSRH